MKTLGLFAAPLAVILLTGSAQQTKGGSTAGGATPATTGTTQPPASTAGSPSTTGASTTGTSSTTGSSTTGTSGSDPGGTFIETTGFTRIEEVKSWPSARLASAQVVTDARHILRLKLRFFNYSGTSYDAQNNRTDSSTRVVAVAVQTPGEFAIMPLTEGGTNNATPGAGSAQANFNPGAYPGGGQRFDLQNHLVVQGPGGDGYWVAYPSLGSAGTLNGGTLSIRVFTRNTSSTTSPSGVSLGSGDTVSESAVTLSVDKLLCEAISLDSRKTYGQPNLEGVLPSDPNAGLDHISFKDWIYKGGAFVGNMPDGSGDLSGQGRLQVRYTGTLPTTTYLGACLTAFATQRKTTGATRNSTIGIATVGLYHPKTSTPSDPNLNVGEAAKWDTRWNIQPQTTATNPYDPAKNAYHYFPVTDAMQSQYVNWQMPYSGQMWREVALALTEDSDVSWQSFSTTQYQSTPGAIFPITDSAIRIWRVGKVN